MPIQLFVEAADAVDGKLKTIEQDVFFQPLAEAIKESAVVVDDKNADVVSQVSAIRRVQEAQEDAGFYEVAKMWVEGYTFLLRIGQGKERGGIGGWAEDGLRVLAVAAPFLSRLGVTKIRNGAGIAAAVDVDASLGNCAWIAATRAARVTGQKLHAVVADLARAAGISVPETGGVRGYLAMLGHLNKIGVTAKQVNLPSRVGKILQAESSIADLANATKNARGSVFIFGVEYNFASSVPGVKAIIPMNHTMLARWRAGALEIIDRTGRQYRSLAELERDAVSRFPALAGISKGVIVPEMVMVESASIVPAFGTTAAMTPMLLDLVAVWVLPGIVQETTLTFGRPAPPASIAGAKYQGPIPPGKAWPPKPDSMLSYGSYFTYAAKPADTLAKVAQAVYGSDALWRPIHDANPKVTNGNQHRAFGLQAMLGLELIIPSQF